MTDTVRDAIKDSGRTLGELSRESGVGTDRISRFMRKERDLTGEALGRLCETLGLELRSTDKHKGET